MNVWQRPPKMNKGYAISIFGPDGAGKSTQIDLLYRFLAKRRAKVRKAWISSHHGIAWVLAQVFIRLGYYTWRPSKECPLAKYVPFEVINSSRVSKWIWMLAELIGLLLSMIIKVELPKQLGYCVIVERGLPSTLADFTYTFGDDFPKTFFAKLLLALSNDKYSFYICLDSEYEILQERRDIRTEPRDYVETQRGIYREFSKSFNCPMVDTVTESLKSTQRLVRAYVLGRSKPIKTYVSGKCQAKMNAA